MSEELKASLCGGIFQVSYLNAFRNTPLVARKMLRHLTHWNAGKYLEAMMKTIRLLLPFVHGVDKFAIEQAVLLAKSHNATLVPLVLIHMPKERRKKGVRLEYLQQSMDFLETVKQKADWYAVQIERLEVFTSDVVQSINLAASEMECEGILLFVNQKGGILLQLDQIKGVMEIPACRLYITHLPGVGRNSFMKVLRIRFSRLLPGRNEQRIDRMAEQESLAQEAGLPVKA